MKQEELVMNRGQGRAIPFFRSIKGKLVVCFLLFALIPLAALGVLVLSGGPKCGFARPPFPNWRR